MEPRFPASRAYQIMPFSSAKMALYLPCVHLSSTPDVFSKSPLIQPPLDVIKLGASAVARRFEIITSQTIREEIPLAM
jgi:hypothetical protein